MAAFAPGTGGDLKSTTLEAALAELATLLQQEESSVTTNPPNRISINWDGDAGNCQIIANLGFTLTVSSTGVPQTVITPYLT